MQAIKEFRWWIEGRSPIWHLMFIVMLYLLFALGVLGAAVVFDATGYAAACGIASLDGCFDKRMLDVLSGDAKEIYPNLSLFVTVGTPVLTVVATSLMTISLLHESGRISLSANACVYEQETLASERATVKTPCVVFRMMNQGGKFLFDVNVNIALRFVGDDGGGGRTFRFFPLTVLGPEGHEGSYPILEPRMPFRVYVSLGQDVQSAIYLGRLSYGTSEGTDLAERLKIIDRDGGGVPHSGNTEESALVVSVRGTDSISGKQTVTSIEYPLKGIRSGKFGDISLSEFAAADSKRRAILFNRINHFIWPDGVEPVNANVSS